MPLHAQVLASLPVIIYELVHNHSERHIVVWFIAGLFVLLAVPLSLHDGGWVWRGCGCCALCATSLCFVLEQPAAQPTPPSPPGPMGAPAGLWGPLTLHSLARVQHVLRSCLIGGAVCARGVLVVGCG